MWSWRDETTEGYSKERVSRKVNTAVIAVIISTHWGPVTHICVSKISEPLLGYWSLDPKEQTSVKLKSEFIHFHSRKCIWKCRLENGVNFWSRAQCVKYVYSMYHIELALCIGDCCAFCCSSVPKFIISVVEITSTVTEEYVMLVTIYHSIYINNIFCLIKTIETQRFYTYGRAVTFDKVHGLDGLIDDHTSWLEIILNCWHQPGLWYDVNWRHYIRNEKGLHSLRSGLI